MELKDKKINFLGDSITQGVGTSCNEARFSEVIKRKAGLSIIRNYGISGTRIAKQQQITNKDWDFYSYCERFSEMDNDADIIVVFGGTNDYGHGDADFGQFSDRTMDTYFGALHFLMRGLINKYPEKTVVFLTPIHRENENTPNESNNRVLKDYVDAIKECARYYSLPVLDLYAVSGIYPDIDIQKNKFCPDGLHPNDEGNARIAERLEAFLRTL